MKGNDFWLDDPEWELLRRKAEKRPIPKHLKQQVAAQRPQRTSKRESPRATTSAETTEKEVVLNLKLSVPNVKLPDVKRFYRAHRKQIVVGGSIAAVLILVVGSLKVIASQRDKAAANKPKSAQEQALAEFNPLVPLENLKDNAGKQSKPEFRYDTEKKVLGFATEYNGAGLTISQQKLPDTFRSNPAGLLSIADSMKADMKPLQTQKGEAYIATDQKTGVQTAVFATDQVLVFIRANKQLDEEEWKLYINQLNPSK